MLELVAVNGRIGHDHRTDEDHKLGLLHVIVAIREQFTNTWDVTQAWYRISIALYVVLHQPAENRSLPADQLQYRFHLANLNLWDQAFDRVCKRRPTGGKAQRRIGVLNEVLNAGNRR